MLFNRRRSRDNAPKSEPQPKPEAKELNGIKNEAPRRPEAEHASESLQLTEEILPLGAYFKKLIGVPSHLGVEYHSGDEYCSGIKLDGIEDETRMNWVLVQGGSAEQSVQKYISFMPRAKEISNKERWVERIESDRRVCYRISLSAEAERLLLCFNTSTYSKTDRTIFIIDSPDQLPKDPEARKRLMELAKANSIGVAQELSQGHFYDFTNEEDFYLTIAGTNPGSADDAADYGVLVMRKIL